MRNRLGISATVAALEPVMMNISQNSAD